jgi:GT2 family glycosyltransferase/glycosyltransferase involved in cell wall biosynthesis
MTAAFRVIALISSFNEEDIISPVIGHLVENGVEVYLIDDHSTDDTVQQASQWLGKGLLDIESFSRSEATNGKFEWAAILRRKEELATTLHANWFIHHDADEIRESPWPSLGLKEAIRWVDKLGYNCVDFKVLNFPPVDDSFRVGDDPKTYFKYCEDAADFDVVQRKAWKAGVRVSLAAAGGHEALFPDRRIFPIKFLMRHYPIRGQQHGLRKVFLERAQRFLDSERAKGWHRQYDHFGESHSFLRDPAILTHFDLDLARFELMAPNRLVDTLATIQKERDELRQHATNLEIDRQEAKEHASNLESDRNELRRHADNLELERADLKRHASNLEQERDQLRQHASNLERERSDLGRHTDSLEAERADLQKHASNLERQRDELKHHAIMLESDRQRMEKLVETLQEAQDSLRQEGAAFEARLRQSIHQVKALEDELLKMKFHSESLHALNQRIDERNEGLERELDAIKTSVVWRSANRLRRLLRGKKAVWGTPQKPPAREPGPIHSSLDIPGEGLTTVTETCLLRGWTCSSDGIERVTVLIDGNQICQFVPDNERPDVALVHPEVKGAGRCGFDMTIQLGSTTAGEHHLEMVIRSGAGNELRHHRSLLVDGHPYHRLLLAQQLSGRERQSLLETVTSAAVPARFELWIDARVKDGIEDTLKSIAAQTYQNFSCHVVGDSTDLAGAFAAESLPEPVQWQGSFVDCRSDEKPMQDYLAFLLAGERLLPDALLHVAARFAKAPASLAYSDHDIVEATGAHADPDHAPDWSPEHLLARNYVGEVFFVRRDAIQNCPLDANGSSWRYDLLLRVTEVTRQIVHIPRVLWSTPRTKPACPAIAAAEVEAVEAALTRRSIDGAVIALRAAPVRRIRRQLTSAPTVSIIVPTTGRLTVVRPMVESLLTKTSYTSYELLFLDNGRGKNPDGIEYLRSKGLQVVERDEPFNWARLNNAGAHACTGELLLFLNDDIEVRESEWLGELAVHALVPDVGTVGALLLYPNGQIQHAGVFLVDHGGGSRHYLQWLHPNDGIYQHLDRVVREVTANTGACLMVRRRLFEEVGGFDEDFQVAFNDIDFCMRLSERGHRNLWTPHCQLIHHESLSRKGADITEDERRLWSRWRSRLSISDPYHNPNLAKDRSDCTIDTSVLDQKPIPTQEAVQGPGINLIGYIRAEMGVGEAARGLARAMEATGIPFVAIDYEYGNPARKGDSTWSHKIVDRPAHAVNVLNVNANLTPEACARLGSEMFEGRYTIGYWVWELPEFPDRWLPALDHVNEVWVPSEFVREALARKANVPVIRIPHAVDKGSGPFLERLYFDLPDVPFLFLSMYDTHSVIERKNPEGAIAAFRDAFAPGNQDVSLVVKINNFDQKEGDRLRALIGDHKNICVIDRTLTRYEVDSLLVCCDCFVSLHRAEGFGLPMAEAMSFGKPVIATYWSGNVDFMDDGCAACVDFQIRELEQNFGPYEAGQKWAEPSIESAARWMRKFSAEPAIARRIGGAGRRRIKESFSAVAVGELIRARLAQIGPSGYSRRQIH